MTMAEAAIIKTKADKGDKTSNIVAVKPPPLCRRVI